MTFHTPSESKFTRHHREEVEMVFSGIDCVLNGERAIYCSSELTTGLRLYSALRENKVKSAGELKEKMGGPWYTANIWNANVKSSNEFARSVRRASKDKEIVITPAPFSAPGWGQHEYLLFWETLLRTRIKSAWFNHNWQYSNGCTFEFAVALHAGLYTFDHRGDALDRAAGIDLIQSAIKELAKDGFDVGKLRGHLEKAQSEPASAGAVVP
ncbi:MAG TPA: hypothetical protein VGZ48_07220 [Candidatus Acidoferrales bacterium]|jgi:hypothetical protein|nr:hypothetical protein [Candidatus Acidoferrales bacterium]